MINELDIPLHYPLASSKFNDYIIKGELTNEKYEEYRRCIDDIITFTKYNSEISINKNLETETFITSIIETHPMLVDWNILSKGSFTNDFICKHINQISLVGKDLCFTRDFVIENWKCLKPHFSQLLWHSPNIFDDIMLKFLIDEQDILRSNLRFVMASARLSNQFIIDNIWLYNKHEYLIFYGNNISDDIFNGIIKTMIENCILKISYDDLNQKWFIANRFSKNKRNFYIRDHSLINFWDNIHSNMTLCQSLICDPVIYYRMYTGSMLINKYKWQTLCSNFHSDDLDINSWEECLTRWIPYAYDEESNSDTASCKPTINFKTLINFIKFCNNQKNTIIDIISDSYMYLIIPDSFNLSVNDKDYEKKKNEYRSQFFYEISYGINGLLKMYCVCEDSMYGSDGCNNCKNGCWAWYGYDYIRARNITSRMIHLYRVSIRTITIIQNKFREYSYAPGGGMFKRTNNHWDQMIESNY